MVQRYRSKDVQRSTRGLYYVNIHGSIEQMYTKSFMKEQSSEKDSKTMLFMKHMDHRGKNSFLYFLYSSSMWGMLCHVSWTPRTAVLLLFCFAVCDVINCRSCCIWRKSGSSCLFLSFIHAMISEGFVYPC